MQTITHPIRQLGLVVAGFLAAILLLESHGLSSWANHLEMGALRTAAVPATGAIQKALAPLGVGALREDILKNLAKVGWSDDAVLLAEAGRAARGHAAKNDAAIGAGCTVAGPANGASPVAASGLGAGVGGVGGTTGVGKPFPNAIGARTPLAAQVPRTSVLAPLAPIEPGKQRVVALAGDSMMAVGLSATMMRQAAGDKNLRIVKVFKSGTGLARPEVFNWMDEYPAMLGAEKPDVVIVAIGANDGQGFVVDGNVLPYGSAAWTQVYQDRLASYLAMVQASGARVVWVGLPPMRAASYDEKIAAINRIAYTVVSQSPQATWWNPVSYVADEAGRFREFATQANGQAMRIRATDGIHLSDEGAGLLTAVLMKWLDPPPAPPAPQATGATTVSAVVPKPASAQPSARHKRRMRKTATG